MLSFRGSFAWVLKFCSIGECLATQSRLMDCREILSTSHLWVRYSSFDRPSKSSAGRKRIDWGWQAPGAWFEPSCSTRLIRPRHSAPSIFSDVGKTSASKSRLITARENVTTYDFGL